MKVKEIIYNWFQCGSVQDRDGAGENWSRVTVGVNGVVDIVEYLPQGEGDRISYVVTYNDGRVIRLFNPNTVEYFKSLDVN